jgi:hypothetical protein
VQSPALSVCIGLHTDTRLHAQIREFRPPNAVSRPGTPAAVALVIMNLRLLPLAFASIALVHCTTPSLGNTTTWDENGTHSLGVTLSMPTDTTGHTASAIVGEPVVVDVFVQDVGPGACTRGFLGGSCSDHTYSDVAAFDLTDVGCDDDLCDVIQVTRDAGRANATITLVPKSTDVTLHATAASSTMSGSGELWLVPAEARGIPQKPARNGGH